MNESDKDFIIRLFLRVLANQALILGALGSLVLDVKQKNDLADRAIELVKEVAETAEMVKLNK